MSNMILSEKELRIGNLLQWEDESEDVVIIIGIDVEGESCSIATNRNELAELDEFKPILLTQEWLLRFGFECEDKLNWWNLPKGNPYTSCHLMQFANGWGWFMSFDNKEENCLVKGFEFVHQLQNLYWELTETELTTNNFIS